MPSWVILRNAERKLLVMKDEAVSVKKQRQLESVVLELGRVLSSWRSDNYVSELQTPTP